MYGFNPQMNGYAGFKGGGALAPPGQGQGLQSLLQGGMPPGNFGGQGMGMGMPQSPMNPMAMLPRNMLSQMSGMPQRPQGTMGMPGMQGGGMQPNNLADILNFILQNRL